MGLVLTATAGLILWIVLWAQGIKAFDAFIVHGADPPGHDGRPDGHAAHPRPAQGLARRGANAPEPGVF